MKKEIRKSNYLKLREAGYNAREANKYKDLSQINIDRLIKEKLNENYVKLKSQLEDHGIHYEE